MSIAKGPDGSISITGDSVRPMAQLMRLHGWRNAATMRTRFAMSSKHYPTVKAFNAEYGVNVSTWVEVFALTDSVIKELRAETTEAIKEQSA